MIITRTPFRISFFGGGTDYPAWSNEHGGEVLSTSIDKYCYITCRHLPPFFDYKHRIVYSAIENVQHWDEIKHPAVRAVLGWANCSKGLEIHHDGDLPARSGLGSSSSFTVGLLHALSALKGQYVVQGPAGARRHPHRAERDRRERRLAGPGGRGLSAASTASSSCPAAASRCRR